MGDTIHKKRKDWPHFDTIHLGSEAYAEGWERIFGKKAKHGEEVDEVRGRRKVQASRRTTKTQRRKKSKGARRMDRSQEIRES